MRTSLDNWLSRLTALAKTVGRLLIGQPCCLITNNRTEWLFYYWLAWCVPVFLISSSTQTSMAKCFMLAIMATASQAFRRRRLPGTSRGAVTINDGKIVGKEHAYFRLWSVIFTQINLILSYIMVGIVMRIWTGEYKPSQSFPSIKEMAEAGLVGATYLAELMLAVSLIAFTIRFGLQIDGKRTVSVPDK